EGCRASRPKQTGRPTAFTAMILAEMAYVLRFGAPWCQDHGGWGRLRGGVRVGAGPAGVFRPGGPAALSEPRGLGGVVGWRVCGGEASRGWEGAVSRGWGSEAPRG